MDDLIKQIFSKEKDIRKAALIDLSEMSFDHISDKQLFDIYNQLELIVENDEKDVSYFARKMIPKIKKVGKIRKLNLDEDPIHEVYTKKADDLIALLSSDQKMVRINSVYALAKTGCSENHIKALEKFAENATEDEAKLAIDSIEAIKSFMDDREEKEKKRKKQRELAKQSLNQKKELKAKPARNYINNNENTVDSGSLWKKAFFSLLIIIIFISSTAYLPGFFINQKDFLTNDSKIIGKKCLFNKATLIISSKEKITIKKIRLTFKGWKEVEK